MFLLKNVRIFCYSVNPILMNLIKLFLWSFFKKYQTAFINNSTNAKSWTQLKNTKFYISSNSDIFTISLLQYDDLLNTFCDLKTLLMLSDIERWFLLHQLVFVFIIILDVIGIVNTLNVPLMIEKLICKDWDCVYLFFIECCLHIYPALMIK